MNIKNILFTVFVLLLSQNEIKAQSHTSELLEQAMTIAQAENKNIFVKFEASWCSWCKKMTNNMKTEATSELFTSNYVLLPIVVNETAEKTRLENPGSRELLSSYKGDTSGLPFWVILDQNMAIIADSFNSKGENLGCPATPDEIDIFIAKLKDTSELSEDELKVIRDVFLIKK